MCHLRGFIQQLMKVEADKNSCTELKSSCREVRVMSKVVKTRLFKPLETADLNKGGSFPPDYSLVPSM